MRILLLLFIVGLCFVTPLTSQAKVNIFACEPEWESLAKEIGGDKVKTFSATHAKQDPHYIRARPSLIAKARSADILFCSGAGLESGWLPILLQKAQSKVQPGKIGYLMAADHVNLLEKPKKLDRSLGDIHEDGNPHLHLNPHNILIIAKEFKDRIVKIDPQHSEYYKANYNSFTLKWKSSISRWEQMALPLKEKELVVYHKTFSYLIDWLSLQQVVSLEPKPGISPTASHLKNVLVKMDKNPADLIILTPYDPVDAALWLKEKTNIPVRVLPYTIGGSKESLNLFKLFDKTISEMLEALN